MIKPITLFQHFTWNVHLIRKDHRKLRLSLTIDWNMIVCSRTTANVASEMCIEYRTIYNSIGRVWEIPDTGITDCQAVDIWSHQVYHLSPCSIRSTTQHVNYFCLVRYFGHLWSGQSVCTLRTAELMMPRCHLMCSLTSLYTHWHGLTPAHWCLCLYQSQTFSQSFGWLKCQHL